MKINLKKKYIVILVVITLALVTGGIYTYNEIHKKNVKTTNFKGKEIGSFSMEDEFSKAPDNVLTALTGTDEFKEFLSIGCKNFVGKQVPINNKVGVVWVVTTPGCGWGAHSAPIWFLQEKEGNYSLLLSTGGIGFKIYSSSWYGLKDIVVFDSSAGYYSDVHYRFDGKKYNSIETKFVTADDPDACKKAPDAFQCD